MIILGVVLVVIGFLINLAILTNIGIALVVIGAVLWVLGATGHAIGGRSHYY